MKKISYLFVFLLFNLSINAQNLIEPPKGFSPQVGNIVSMLNDLKSRVTSTVKGMSTYEIDYVVDENANRIGALIMHLAATEAYYQVYTFEKRGFNKEEKEKWETALDLGEKAREKFQGHSIKYYLDIYSEVRKKTMKELKKKDDAWLMEKNDQKTMNNHWAWYHVMEHQANHMGQIRFLAKRIPEKK